VLSPENEMKQFYLPPGFHAELVAAEPLVQDPIAIDWDADGRMWVVEYPEYVPDLQAPEPNLDVRRVPELHANGNGDFGRIESSRCHLVEQRLEEVMIAMIDEDYLDAVLVGQRLRGVQPREAGAHDNN